MEISVKKKPKTDNEFVFKGTFTAGQMLAIKHALASYNSPVAKDVSFMLNQSLLTPDGKSILE